MRQETVIDALKPERLMLYRDELNSHVLKEMQRLQSSIDLRLDTEVLALDLDKQQVTFAQGNKPTEVSLIKHALDQPCCSPLFMLCSRDLCGSQM